MAALQQHFIKTALRIPPELHKAVHDSARAQDRTFNGQLLALIRTGLAKPTDGKET